jgi:hypothetical protein
MDRSRSERCVTCPRNIRMKETTRRQRRTNESSEADQGPKGAVAPHVDRIHARTYTHTHARARAINIK